MKLEREKHIDEISSKPLALRKSIPVLFFLVLFPLVFFDRLTDFDLLPKTVFLSIGFVVLLLYNASSRKVFAPAMPFSYLILIVSFVVYSLISAWGAQTTVQNCVLWSRLILPFAILISASGYSVFEKESIFRFLPLAVVLISLLFAYQYFFIYHQSNHVSTDERVAASFGNKNFLAESIALMLPLLLAGVAHRVSVIFNLFAMFLSLIIIFLIQSVSSWAAVFLLACISLTYGLIFPSAIRTKLFRFIFSNKLLSVVVGSVIFVSATLFFWKSNGLEPIQRKIASFELLVRSNPMSVHSEAAENTNSVFERVLLWRNTWQLFKQNPVVGNGLGEWKIQWAKYGIGGAPYLNSGVMHYEHPHNEYLYFLSELGVIGTFLLFSIVLIPFIGIIRNRKSFTGKEHFFVFLLIAGVAELLLMSSFGYPLHRPFSVFMMTIYMYFALLMTNPSKHVVDFYKPVLLTLLIVFFSYTAYGNYMELQAQRHMDEALRAQAKQNFNKMHYEVNQAYSEFYRIDENGTPLDWYRGFASFYGSQDSALAYFKSAEQINPYHIQVLSDLGAMEENSGRHKKAAEYFTRALNLIPKYNEARINLAVAQYNMGHTQEALVEIQKAKTDGEQFTAILDAILKKYTSEWADSTSEPKLKLRLEQFIKTPAYLVTIYNQGKKMNSDFRTVLNDSLYHGVAFP